MSGRTLNLKLLRKPSVPNAAAFNFATVNGDDDKTSRICGWRCLQVLQHWKSHTFDIMLSISDDTYIRAKCQRRCGYASDTNI